MSAMELRPEVGSVYGHAWHRLWKYFLELFLIFIIAFIIDLPGGAGSWTRTVFDSADFFSFIYSILVGGPISFGLAYAYLKAARDESLEVKDVFAAFKNYWNAVLASLLVSVIVIIGLFLLVVPGFYFACKLAFTPYLVVDRKMEVIQAIKESWLMTDGHAGTIFLVFLLAIPIAIAGVIVFVVGFFIAGMWISLALASLYYAVSRTQPASPAA